jgi:fatty-acyl-CoA synthase
MMLERLNGRDTPELADAAAYVGCLDRPKRPALPAAPLMHGTAAWFAMAAMNRGAAIVTLTSRHLEPTELLDAIDRDGVGDLCIVGDAFARPIVEAWRRRPGRWSLGSLQVVVSSGAALSPRVRDQLHDLAPKVTIADTLGSSESGPLARSVTSVRGGTNGFRLGEGTRVIDNEWHDVKPGSGRAGRLAVTGFLPVGYLHDPEKTAATFVELDGRRYVVAGDWARVEADGMITFLGRESSCINTAGEKVYAEEVENAIRAIAGVADAAVVGVPDDRFGQAVTALVELADSRKFSTDDMIEGLRAKLAGYKLPRHIFVVPSVGRGPNGKLDHGMLRQHAIDLVNEKG